MSTPTESIPINRERLLETFLKLLSVDSFHGDEDRVVPIITGLLEPLGVSFRQDASANLIGVWPARGKQARPIMLNAHMDTVRPTPGMVPVVKDDGVYSDGSSVLGADDKAGLAAIVEAVLAVHESGLDHAPIELLFTVGEDVGHIGSKAFEAAEIESRVGFVLDAGGPVGTIVTRAPGSRRFTVTFTGKAAHAGIEPELGVSAIAMLARAIDRMPLGRVDAETTANVGLISGGEASNIIPPEAKLEAEARSLSEARLDEQIAAMHRAIDEAAAAFGGSAAYDEHTFYQAYELAADDPALRLAEVAVSAAGLQPQQVGTGGGSDAHEFNRKGIASACLGMGYVDVHSVNEFMPHEALEQITQVTVQLILRA